jgi:hypothetical protein
MSKETDGRSDGWKTAQRSGSKSETSAARLLRHHAASGSLDYFDRFGISTPSVKPKITAVGAKRVPALDGGTTPPKADIEIRASKTTIGVSVKSSPTGQVGLHSPHTFVAAVEAHGGYEASQALCHELQLFAGSVVLADDIVGEQVGRPPFAQRVVSGHNRIPPLDRRMYSRERLDDLVDWLTFGIVEMADVVFSKGTSMEMHATALWYLVPGATGGSSVDEVYLVADLLDALRVWRDAGGEVAIGHQGSTFELPFGSLQAHQGRLQFQHSREKLRTLGLRAR